MAHITWEAVGVGDRNYLQFSSKYPVISKYNP